MLAALTAVCVAALAPAWTHAQPAAAAPSAAPAQTSPQTALDRARAEREAGRKALEANRYAEAEPLLRRSHQALADALGAEQEETLSALSLLAVAIEEQGRYVEAERLDRQLHEASARVLGAEHPLTLAALGYLAYAIDDQGRHAEAETLYRQLYDIRSRTLGADAPDTLNTLSNLASAVMDQGRYAEAETLDRRLLEARTRLLGPEAPDTLTTINNLASDLAKRGRYAEAETLYRQLYQTRARVLGPERPDTLTTLNNLAYVIHEQGRDAEAERLDRQVYAARSRVLGAQAPATLTALSNLAGVVMDQGRYAEAETLDRQAYEADLSTLSAGHPNTLNALDRLASAIDLQGRYAEAEALYRQAYDTSARLLGAEAPDTLTALNNLATAVANQNRYAEAERLDRQLYDAETRLLGAEHPETLVALNNLADAIATQGRYAEAEALDRRLYETRLRVLGAEHPDSLVALSNLALTVTNQGRYAEAETRDRRLYDTSARVLGADHPATLTVLGNLAYTIGADGRYAQADGLERQLYEARARTLGAGHPDSLAALEILAQILVSERARGEAAQAFGAACAGMTDRSASPTLSRTARGAGELANAANCNRQWAQSLWRLAREGAGSPSPNARGAIPLGGAAPPQQALGDAALGLAPAPQTQAALQAQAFAAAQSGERSAAGGALALRTAALAAAAFGEGQAAADYEQALTARAALQDSFARAAAEADADAKVRQQNLSAQIVATQATIDRLASELSSKAPSYWAYRSPTSASVAELQAPAAPGKSELLHDDEALVFWMWAPGPDRGLVFAVSRENVAWAEMGLGGDDIAAKIQALRGQLDGRRPLDRQTAFALYQALLGDKAIQEVTADKATLLIVPSGPLTSLPPSLLVTEAPPGGPAMDSDPAAMRATHWLVKEKAIAVLPAASSLKALRQLMPTRQSAAGETLLALADPDFQGLGETPQPAPSETPVLLGPASAFEADGRPLKEMLKTLPPLGGTLAEARSLESVLGAPARSPLLGETVLAGPNASKTRLEQLQKAQALERVNVLVFATHGLVTGDFRTLTEPALALAYPGPTAAPDDQGLLTASDVTALTLTADWVILSACNTAGPSAGGAEGLSGLARAFFYAGARTLLVSHWHVREDATTRIATAIFQERAAEPTLSKAQALRKAELDLMTDTSDDDISFGNRDSFANPSAWAPFVVVGEPR
jgi:CHAT domain-containing protein/flagellar biosynthesis regulator FlbT